MPSVPKRVDHTGDYETRLEKVVRNDLEETHYHWFLNEEYPKVKATKAAKRVFGMLAGTTIEPEEMFDSVTILMPGKDEEELEDRHDELEEKIQEFIQNQ